MENDSASYTVLYKCWIFCRFLSVFYNSSWTLLSYWKRARNLASAESAFPPPTSFSSLHMLNAYRLKAKSASWILWILIYFRPIWTHTLFKELLLLLPCCIHPLYSPPNKETEKNILSQLPLSFIYCIYFLLFLSFVLCLHPEVCPGNWKYHIKLTTGLYDKEKEITFFNPGSRIHFTICVVEFFGREILGAVILNKKLQLFYMESDICHLQWEAHFIHGDFTKKKRKKRAEIL